MTKLAPETTLNDLGLEEGDALTGIVENGQFIVTVHPAKELEELEESLIEASTDPGKPMDDAYFDNLRNEFGPQD